MLLDVFIENFALIEKLRISFSEGLNVLTGETGAGKSILIDAVNMAIGLRADKNYIRTGADKAMIQLIFQCNHPCLKNLFKEHGIDLEDDGLLILTREIYSNGRSISRMNDKIVTVALVREISKYLIDIHGQHEHQSLLYPENHMNILDSFGEKEISPLKMDVANKFQTLKSLEKKLFSLYGNETERERKIDLLKFQLKEIDDCHLKKGEEEALLAEKNLLSNSEKIFSIISRSYEILYHGNEQYQPVLDGVGHIVNELNHIKDLDPTLSDMYQILEDSLWKLQDVARDMRLYKDRIEFDPAALENIEKRLDIINHLKRKYGKTIEEILTYRQLIFEELEEIINSEQIAKELISKIDETKKELCILSEKLSEIRKKAARRLQDKITEELTSLNMSNVVFKVDFSYSLDKSNQYIFTSKGIDRIEFLISTNPGEPLKPLSKIVSGGEMSRIMLAFKTILAKIDNIPTLIFDEIDAGISGRTATIVGEKLARISRTHQILCITHLPQIALMADKHFYIEKNTGEGSTKTVVKQLKDQDRIMELARLLGGVSLTDLTVEHAKEMLQLGKDYKSKIQEKKEKIG
ncbi:DNA repair protein RecN [Thermotalea metallivorans]|uniref:DNA repair protein RecN n=1 Tax=Thermotalea metallivorans TaxID=520762 RepID=A0A140L8D8_9FIRM|nr:DNA repair protein RecN [Thermotalea metallivorans]KXG76813.1 DNA repair protein RecN [Thermotalea metallivorans]